MTAAKRTDRRSHIGSLSGKLFLAAVLAVFVLFPLIRMLCNISGESLRKVFSSPQFPQALRNSLGSTALATLIAVLLGFLAALCMERTTMRGRVIFTTLLTLPMLIPSSSHGMGLVQLLGNNGILTRFFGLESSVYGMKGIVIGSVLYSFPVAFLMLSDVMRYENGAPYEAARVLGISAPRRFLHITLPYLAKPLLSAVFAVFSMVITDYGVPTIVGGKCKTISVLMYEEVIGQVDFARGAVYGLILLVPAVVAFVADLISRTAEVSTSTPTPPAKSAGRTALTAAYLFCGVISILILLPILSSVTMAFSRQYPTDLRPSLNGLKAAFRRNDAGLYLRNSILIALVTAVVGTILAFAMSYMTARMRSPLSSGLHLCSITSAAVPGVVLGLSYVMAFHKMPLYDTMAILVIVNSVHFFASPYLMSYNSLSKLGSELEAVGETLGIGRWRMVRDVIIPQSRGTLLEMFSYFFVNSMMTISAVSFLATGDNKPLALMINQFQALVKLESAAVVSVLILAVNLLLRGAIHLIKYLIGRRAGDHLAKGEKVPYESDEITI